MRPQLASTAQLDEPLSSLDADLRQTLRIELRQLQHNSQEAMIAC
jgi:ABC-type sugar transport system ATPase subunit